MSPSVQTAGTTLKRRSLVSNWATHPMVIENESCEMHCECVLAFTGAITVAKGILGGTTNYITSISGFVCNATEPSLSACLMVPGPPSTSCSLAASVVCQLSDVARAGNCTHGDIRLVNGTSQINGRFEVCINNAWGTMCSKQVTSREAAVVCRQLNASNPNIRVNAAGQ